MTAIYFVSYSENSFMFHYHPSSFGVNWRRTLLGERKSFFLSFSFLLYNGKHWLGSWEFLGENGAAESIWYTTGKKYTFLIHEAQPLKCKGLFQSLHPDLFSQEMETETCWEAEPQPLCALPLSCRQRAAWRRLRFLRHGSFPRKWTLGDSGPFMAQMSWRAGI